MCGNGIRCVGKYVYDNGHTDKEQVRIETLAGVLTLRLHVSGGKVEAVTVDMGEPRLAPKDIPVGGPGEDFINRPLRVQGRGLELNAGFDGHSARRRFNQRKRQFGFPRQRAPF